MCKPPYILLFVSSARCYAKAHCQNAKGSAKIMTDPIVVDVDKITLPVDVTIDREYVKQHIKDELKEIYDTGIGVFSENGYVFQKLRWHLLGATFEILVVPVRNTKDAFEFGVDYDFIGNCRELIDKFLTEPGNYENNYDALWFKAMDNF